MKTGAAVAVALGGILFATPSARADFSCGATVRHSRRGGYEYVFCDDGLFREDMAGDPAMIPVYRKGRRVLFHRPRLQFVQELLKSIENM